MDAGSKSAMRPQPGHRVVSTTLVFVVWGFVCLLDSVLLILQLLFACGARPSVTSALLAGNSSCITFALHHSGYLAIRILLFLLRQSDRRIYAMTG